MLIDNYKAILFDVDGTLVYPATPLNEKVYNLLNNLNFNFTHHQVELALNKAIEWFWQNNVKFGANTKLTYYNTILVFLDEIGIKENKEQIATRIGTELLNTDDSKLYPEVKEVLHKLKLRNIKLGIVSGRDIQLHHQIKNYGIKEYFEAIITTTDANCSKSDKRLYQFALKKLNLSPDEVIHIGDTYEGDIIVPQSIGITAILIDREDKYKDYDCIRIKNLNEIFSLGHCQIKT